MNALIKKVVDFLEEARAKHNVSKSDLEDNGAIAYANANDGTDFDWRVNNRLCEFGYGTKDGNRWAFKLLLMNDGMSTIYYYADGEMKPVDTIQKQIMSAEEAEELKDLMIECADDKFKWDCTLDELNLM